MLEEAKQHCDFLICALQTDPTIDRPEKNKPVQSIVERWIQLDAVKYVDQIVPYTTEEDLENIFKSFKLDVRIIGEEYRESDFTAKDICKKQNIKVIYNGRGHDWSSSGLRKRIK
jgi:glycerol-3-phosphate cytidylyltransferase